MHRLTVGLAALVVALILSSSALAATLTVYISGTGAGGAQVCIGTRLGIGCTTSSGSGVATFGNVPSGSVSVSAAKCVHNWWNPVYGNKYAGSVSLTMPPYNTSTGFGMSSTGQTC